MARPRLEASGPVGVGGSRTTLANLKDRWDPPWLKYVRNPYAGAALKSIVPAAAPGEKLSALELLRRENELLRQTLDVANVPVDAISTPSASSSKSSSSLSAKSVRPKSVATSDPVQLSLLDAEGSGTALVPEDYWSPCIEVPDGMEYVDEYGPISPVPNHDGTMCFKWDNTLWSAAEHFKVCSLGICIISAAELTSRCFLLRGAASVAVTVMVAGWLT